MQDENNDQCISRQVKTPSTFLINGLGLYLYNPQEFIENLSNQPRSPFVQPFGDILKWKQQNNILLKIEKIVKQVNPIHEDDNESETDANNM